MDVGEGRTSVSLEGGSLRASLFQMPLPQGNELEPGCPRPTPVVAWACVPQVLDSAEGVLGCDVVGDIELEANEPFRGGGPDWVVSFNQEALLVGF
jgi:hypothetical protein